MPTKQQLMDYRSKLADRSQYADAPDWVRAILIEKLDLLLALDDPEFAIAVQGFRLGAARAIADQCGSECDQLLGDIPRA